MTWFISIVASIAIAQISNETAQKMVPVQQECSPPRIELDPKEMILPAKLFKSFECPEGTRKRERYVKSYHGVDIECLRGKKRHGPYVYIRKMSKKVPVFEKPPADEVTEANHFQVELFGYYENGKKVGIWLEPYDSGRRAFYTLYHGTPKAGKEPYVNRDGTARYWSPCAKK